MAGIRIYSVGKLFKVSQISSNFGILKTFEESQVALILTDYNFYSFKSFDFKYWNKYVEFFCFQRKTTQKLNRTNFLIASHKGINKEIKWRKGND